MIQVVMLSKKGGPLQIPKIKELRVNFSNTIEAKKAVDSYGRKEENYLFLQKGRNTLKRKNTFKFHNVLYELQKSVGCALITRRGFEGEESIVRVMYLSKSGIKIIIKFMDWKL